MRKAEQRLKFAQSFGDSSQPHNDVDTITTGMVSIEWYFTHHLLTHLLVKFDGSGNFMATGDKGGRIVLFQKTEASREEDNSYKNETKDIETAW